MRADNIRFAIAITRLTSIKSLCKERSATERFALHIAQQVQRATQEVREREVFDEAEWEAHKRIANEAIALMEGGIETLHREIERGMEALRKEIDSLTASAVKEGEFALYNLSNAAVIPRRAVAVALLGAGH